MRKCRECASPVRDPYAILCPGCRKAASEKRRARKRERARAQYSTVPRNRRPGRPKQTQKQGQLCLTAGCGRQAEGSALYCDDCRRKRRNVQQKKYRDIIRSLQLDQPAEPPTNLNWLDKFSDWAKSGLSYSEYQKAKWLKGEK